MNYFGKCHFDSKFFSLEFVTIKYLVGRWLVVIHTHGSKLYWGVRRRNRDFGGGFDMNEMISLSNCNSNVPNCLFSAHVEGKPGNPPLWLVPHVCYRILYLIKRLKSHGHLP